MRQGCVAVGEIVCDKCSRVLQHPDRYLAVTEDKRTARYCVDCALKMGFAHYKTEKGEQVITFFAEE